MLAVDRIPRGDDDMKVGSEVTGPVVAELGEISVGVVRVGEGSIETKLVWLVVSMISELDNITEGSGDWEKLVTAGMVVVTSARLLSTNEGVMATLDVEVSVTDVCTTGEGIGDVCCDEVGTISILDVVVGKVGVLIATSVLDSVKVITVCDMVTSLGLCCILVVGTLVGTGAMLIESKLAVEEATTTGVLTASVLVLCTMLISNVLSAICGGLIKLEGCSGTALITSELINKGLELRTLPVLSSVSDMLMVFGEAASVVNARVGVGDGTTTGVLKA